LHLGDFELLATCGAVGTVGPVKLAIRPERVRIKPFGTRGPNQVPAMVERLVYMGSATQVIMGLAPGETIQALIPNSDGPIACEQGTPVEAMLPAEALRVLPITGNETLDGRAAADEAAPSEIKRTTAASG
jgi:hypothetical protein